MRSAVVASLILALGCKHDPEPGRSDTAPSASAPAVERPCHLTWNGYPVPLASELGQKIEVAEGTRCVVLDAGDALTRIRITEGAFANAVAWAQSRAVVTEGSR
jgi:hypothetical protein